MLFIHAFVYALIALCFQRVSCLPAGAVEKIKNCFGCSPRALTKSDSFSSAESSNATPKSFEYHEARKQHHLDTFKQPGCHNCFNRVKHASRADHHSRQKIRKEAQDAIGPILDLREATYASSTASSLSRAE